MLNVSVTDHTSAVCTLFEGHYHSGVGILVNSLYKNGFRGVVWAGYRGPLPPWASNSQECENYKEFSVGEGCVIRFIPVTTRMHLTNFKPEFMLQLWLLSNPVLKTLLYFDPDILVKCCWHFYVEWAQRGVALCEEITNGKMPNNHPVREAWKEFGAAHHFVTSQVLNQYFNAGFVGVSRDAIDFLSCWSKIMIIAENEGYVDLNCMSTAYDRSNLFTTIDQDALNMATMFSDVSLSTIGPEGMDFIAGGFTMSHGIGSPKSWCKRMFLQAIRGNAPGAFDRQFIRYVSHPIKIFTQYELVLKELDLRAGCAVGRFYKRG